MKRTIKSSALGTVHSLRPKRINVSEAKAQLSEVLRQLPEGPTVIHNRGRDVGVLLSMSHYDELVAERADGQASPVKAFLATTERLKQSYGGGVQFTLKPTKLKPRDPFGER